MTRAAAGKLRDYLAVAHERTLEARPHVEREWHSGKLILRSTDNALEVRYLVRELVARSWEFRFGPNLTPRRALQLAREPELRGNPNCILAHGMRTLLPSRAPRWTP